MVKYTKSRSARWFGLGAGLALALALPGCVPADDGPGLDGGPDQDELRDSPDLRADSANGGSAQAPLPLRRYDEADETALRGASPGVRWIAVTAARAGEDYDCRPGGFQDLRRRGGTFRARHLLERDDQEGPGAVAIPPELRRFCVIEWEPADVERPALPTSRDVSVLRRHLAERYQEYAQDLLAPGPQADALEEAVWRPMALAWRRQLDELRPLPRPVANGRLLPIRIAVADTSPFSDDGDANPGNSEHGLAMGRIAKILSCPPGGPCPGYVTHHLALPRVSSTRRPANGGFFGYQSEVAVAVEAAVRKWKAAPEAEGGGRLIINLSLGWDGRFGGRITTGPQDLRPGVRAVYEALGLASCHGALVIASAGNRSGGPNEIGNRGPLFPGGWEEERAPTPQQCRQRFDIEEPVVSRAPYQPLVYAVGGVRGDDVALGNTRPGGRPTLAMPAFQAVVGVDDGSGSLVSSGIHTGTSVAAAGLSGIAGALWSYRPDLDAHALMALIYDGAVPLSPDPDGAPVVADFCQIRNCPIVRRISMCEAYKRVCAGGGGACDAVDAAARVCKAPPAYTGALNVLEPLVADMRSFVRGRGRLAGEPDASTLVDRASPPPTCRYDVGATIRRAGTSATPAAPCPTGQFYLREASPWAAPQPWDPLCPDCFLILPRPGDVQGAEADLFTNEDFSGQVFYDGLLTFTKKDGTIIDALLLEDLGVSAVTGGEAYFIKDIDAPIGFSHVYLEFLTQVKNETTGKWEVTSTLDELAWW